MVKTTHVGSLPRTQDVVDFIFAREQEKPFDQGAFDVPASAEDLAAGRAMVTSIL